MYSFPEICDVILIPDVAYHLRQLFVGPPFLEVVGEGAWDCSDLKGHIARLLLAGRHGRMTRVMEHECRSVPIGVPCSWCTDLRLPHWICTIVFFCATETKLVSLSLSKVKSPDSVATLHLSWIAAASWK